MIRSVLVLILLAGCTAPWTKPGATPEALQADESECSAAAVKAFPPQLGPPPNAGVGIAQPGYSCLPNRGCVPTDGSYLPPPSATDVNAEPRAESVAECMKGRGWSR